MSVFDKYVEQGEPGQVEKAHIWQTAIGLQDVDGLNLQVYIMLKYTQMTNQTILKITHLG